MSISTTMKAAKVLLNGDSSVKIGHGVAREARKLIKAGAIGDYGSQIAGAAAGTLSLYSGPVGAVSALPIYGTIRAIGLKLHGRAEGPIKKLLERAVQHKMYLLDQVEAGKILLGRLTCKDLEYLKEDLSKFGKFL